LLPFSTACTRMLSSSPIEAGTSPDWHLAGLLTYASTNLNRLPRKIPSGWSLAPCSVLSEYSYGVVADSNRASRHQMEQLYICLSFLSQEPIIPRWGRCAFLAGRQTSSLRVLDLGYLSVGGSRRNCRCCVYLGRLYDILQTNWRWLARAARAKRRPREAACWAGRDCRSCRAAGARIREGKRAAR